MITLPQPPITATSPQAINNYLIQIVNYLNVALNSLNTDSLAPEFREALAAVNASIQSDKSAAEKGLTEFNALKSLIIKTADTIYETMESEFKKFSGEYVAASDFGTYTETTEQTITENAKLSERNFTDVQEVVGAYKLSIAANIKMGNLGTLGELTDQYGIGIGQYDVLTDGDGNIVYTDENDKGFCTITSEKITFWNNNLPIAYISNNKLYIANAHFTQQFDIGYDDDNEGKWRTMGESGKGYVIKWIGGTA